MVVQTARMEGRIAATNAILGATRQATYDVVPSGSFTDPEYGRVGLTEAQAARQHESSSVSPATMTCSGPSPTAAPTAFAS